MMSRNLIEQEGNLQDKRSNTEMSYTNNRNISQTGLVPSFGDSTGGTINALIN
jgi:hypothetical protein